MGIISFEINAGPVNEDSVNTTVGVMLDDCESGVLGQASIEALRPVLGDEISERIQVAEITDIMVSMSKKETEEKENKLDDAMTKAKEAANIRMKERDDIANSLKEVEQKKTDERKKRREDRKKRRKHQ